MKRLTILLSFIAVTAINAAIAQKVGIGTQTPSARLHIASPDSAVLIVQNLQSIDLNVDNGIYFKTGSVFSGAIKSIGTSNYDARLGLFTYTQGNATVLKERLSILDDGKVGIGTTTPTTALDVNGQLRIRGGTPGAGKVLTSDAYGVATWQAPAVVAFRSVGLLGGDPLTLLQQTWTHVLYSQIPQYNYGSGFQGLGGKFQAPAKGIYHFDARIDLEDQQWEMHMRLLQKRGTTTWEAAYIKNTGIAGGDGVTQLHNLIISTDLLVEDGDLLWIEAFSYGAPSIQVLPGGRGNWFDGHMITPL